MREAIGATWIFGIVLAFMTLFSGFLAYSVNYSKAFRLKDGLLEIIEKRGGFNERAVSDGNELMNTIGYSSKGTCYKFFELDGETTSGNEVSWVGVTTDVVSRGRGLNKTGAYNYCVQRVDSSNSAGEMQAKYYKVYVFFSLSLPILGKAGNLFYVTGETSNIYYPNDISDFS